MHRDLCAEMYGNESPYYGEFTREILLSKKGLRLRRVSVIWQRGGDARKNLVFDDGGRRASGTCSVCGGVTR